MHKFRIRMRSSFTPPRTLGLSHEGPLLAGSVGTEPHDGTREPILGVPYLASPSKAEAAAATALQTASRSALLCPPI